MQSTNDTESRFRLAVIRVGDRDAAAAILQQTLRMNSIDARTRIAHVPAVWPETFPAEAAEQAARQLREEGGIAAAVDEGDLPDLRTARTLHHVRCQPEGLVIMSIAGEPERTIAWEDVALMSVADVAGLRQESASGLPDGVFRHDPGITAEAPVRHHGLEMWLITRSPVGGHRIVAEWMNYEYLEARRSASTSANFGHLVEDIRRAAPELIQTPSAEEYDPASVRAPQSMDSPAAHRDAVAAHWAVAQSHLAATEQRRSAPPPMTAAPTLFRAESYRLVEAHRRLQVAIEALRNCRSAVDAEAPPLPEEMSQCVEQLRATLEEHFRLEEDGGYLREVLEIAPRYHSVAESLRRQHDSLREQLRRIDTRTDSPEELVERIDRFLLALEAHEHAENAVVQSTFEDDLAAGD